MLPHTKELFASAISSPAIAMIIGYITSLLVSLIGFGLLNIVISKSVGVLLGGLFDRLLGIAFGAMRGAAIISAMYLGFVISWNMLDGKTKLFDEDKDSYPNAVKTAYTYDYMVTGKNALIDLLPTNIDSSLADLNKKFGSAAPASKPDTTSTEPDNFATSSNIIDEDMPDLFKEKFESFLPKDDGSFTNQASE